MIHEFRCALRRLLKGPGFTLASTLTLALGLGATTAIFSVLYAVMLRPFPYPDAEQMVVMWQKGPQMEMSIAWPTTQDWQREQQAFEALAVSRRDRFNLSDPGQLAENVTGTYASLQSTLLSLSAVLARGLALTGLYSVVAYGVTLRRREIGVRMALGAMARDVVSLMLRQGLVPLAIGIAAGIAGALAAGRAIASQLFEVAPWDPLVLAGTALILAASAALACWLPARRATRVNPVEALRSE